MRAGYFREFTKKPANPWLSQSIGTERSENEELIVKYLRSGIVLNEAHGEIRDPLDEKHPVVGRGSILTDEFWDWPDYLPVLIERYHVVLPKAFVQHMDQNQWRIPAG
jgi:hypothetical protein